MAGPPAAPILSHVGSGLQTPRTLPRMWFDHLSRQYHLHLMTPRKTSPSTEHVISHVRDLIARGHLRTGDRLPPERQLVTKLGVSRPTVRSALRALAAMGVVEARHGSGTYIPGGPPKLDSQALS